MTEACPTGQPLSEPAPVPPDSLLKDQTFVLQLIASGAELESSLASIARMIERHHQAALCSICMFDGRRKRVELVIAPSMPQDLVKTLEGLPIDDPSKTPCSLVFKTREPVIVQDVNSDPQWHATPFAEVMRAHSLRQCRWTPIFDGSNSVCGTFGIFAHSPEDSAALDDDLNASAAFLASIAIKRALDEKKILEKEESLRLAVAAANVGIWNWDLRTGDLVWTNECKQLFGLAPDDTIDYPGFLELLHPDDRATVRDAVSKTITAGLPYSIEYRVMLPDGSV